MSDEDLIIALGQKWRRMPDNAEKLCVAVALDALLQEYHGVESVYDWIAVRKRLAMSVVAKR